MSALIIKFPSPPVLEAPKPSALASLLIISALMPAIMLAYMQGKT